MINTLIDTTLTLFNTTLPYLTAFLLLILCVVLIFSKI